MSSTVTLKALGLNFQPNQLEVPPGSLTVASNVLVRRDSVLEPRRGFKLYGTSLLAPAERVKQLISYKNRILRQFTSSLQYDSDNNGTFTSFAESFSEAQSGLRTKSIEANGNLYLTSSGGVKKISVKDASGFSSASITKAGGVKAIDVSPRLDVTLGNQSGFLDQDAAVAYRVLWLTEDVNGNLIQGTPSANTSIYNYMSDLMLQDYMNLTGSLDDLNKSGSIIKYGQFTKNYPVLASSSESELQSQMKLMSNQLDYQIIYASDATPTAQIPLKIYGMFINPGTTDVHVCFRKYTLSCGTTTVTSGDIYEDSTGNRFICLTTGSGITSVDVSGLVSPTGTDLNPVIGSRTSVGSVQDIPSFTISSSTSVITMSDYLAINDKIFLTSTSSVANSTAIDGFTLSNAYSRVFDSTAANATDNTLRIDLGSNPHLFQSGMPVTLTAPTGTLPTGLNAGQTYYIINPTTYTFQLSTTKDGSAIDITAAGTSTNSTISVVKSGNLNGKQIITSVSTNGIKFTSTAMGAITLTNSKVISYEFRNINETVGTDQSSNLNDLVVSTPATHDESLVIQNTLSRYIAKLQILPIGVVNSTLNTTYLSNLDVTTTANVKLEITIPQDAQNSSYFFQIYRSSQVKATGVLDLSLLTPNDELQLVYEAYPTPAEITAKKVTVLDETADSFRGANLYTNAFSGEGITQANDIPPFCTDINRFKGSIFYANTKTKQRLLVQLLGITNIKNSYNPSNKPKLMVSDGATTNLYTFQLGAQQVQQIVCDTKTNTTNDGYIVLYSTNDYQKYYFVIYKTGSGTTPGSATADDVVVKIDISDLTTAPEIAQRLADKINIYLEDFYAEVSGSNVNVTNIDEGITTAGSINSLGGAWAISTTTTGTGEDSSTNSVLLSSLVSPSQATDATARSLVRMINRNNSESVYAYYISSSDSTPGQMLLEGRNLNSPEFYLLANNTILGASFSPDLSPNTNSITSFSNVSPYNITTSSSHGLVLNDKVLIIETGTLSTPNWTGLRTVTNVANSTNFSVGTTTVSGTTGVFLKASEAIYSSNEEKKNRVYYSKTDQPEAVPIVNYFDIGASDKAILRIFPLRDSLFAFKEDGLYRISGESLNFIVSLFDGSCILQAPDSVSLANNTIYAWTSQGISTVGEAGVNFNISRPIDTDILKKSTSQFTNFKTATWGIGYDSDNSYLVSTVVSTSDTYAQITYRYSTTTNTWTTFDKSNTCGVVNTGDDKLYLGAGDTDYVEKERKDYARSDYADREFNLSIGSGGIFGTTLYIPTSGISVGDVLVQEQYVTKYLFNNLLMKLDSDSGMTTHQFIVPSSTVFTNDIYTNNGSSFLVINDLTGGTKLNTIAMGGEPLSSGTLHRTSGSGPLNITYTEFEYRKNYESTLSIVAGDNLHNKLTALAVKLDSDLGTGTTFQSLVGVGTDFTSIKNSYNAIITQLNLNPQLAFSNYKQIDETTNFEVIVNSVNKTTGSVVVNLSLDFLQGTITVYKAIISEVVYSPNTLGDPLSLKHFRESTAMFENKAFTKASLSFSTDLLPAFISVSFNGDGNGIFGHNNFFGSGFFGGSSNSAPMRTFIPRDCQRCRYINLKFSHTIARENYALYGITLTGDLTSIKGYR